MDLEGLYPVRAPVPWVEEDGRVVVLLPKPLGRVAATMRRLLRGPAHLRVPLDDVGSQAFRLADGARTGDQLAAQLLADFGDRAGPRERALAFLATMARNRLLLLSEAPTRAAEPPNAAVRTVTCTHCGGLFHAAEPEGTRLRCPACGRPVR